MYTTKSRKYCNKSHKQRGLELTYSLTYSKPHT